MSFETLVYLALFGGAFFLMMRMGRGSDVAGHSQSRGEPGSTNDGGLGNQLRSTGSADGDVDPVCGKAVERASAKTAMHDGRVYYFCSRTCREKFEAAPASYVKTAGATSEGASHRHGCC